MGDAPLDTPAGLRTPAAQLLQQCWNDLAWGGSPVALMPDAADIPSVLLPGLLNDANFPALPAWNGRAAETGSLARMQRHPSVAAVLASQGTSIHCRMFARLTEIGDLFARLYADAAGTSPWVNGTFVADGGLAWVQNARGLLVHYAKLDAAGRIATYRIVAPTEWNFHPSGAFTHGLAGRTAGSPDAARRQAELLAISLDPCVSHQIEVQHA
jgi:uptake hydrogenase large subunit